MEISIDQDHTIIPLFIVYLYCGTGKATLFGMTIYNWII